MLKRKRTEAIPDLQSQLEALLDQVWRSELDARFWARMDAIERLERQRPKPKKER